MHMLKYVVNVHISTHMLAVRLLEGSEDSAAASSAGDPSGGPPAPGSPGGGPGDGDEGEEGGAGAGGGGELLLGDEAVSGEEERAQAVLASGK
jgi:hypothetical protein